MSRSHLKAILYLCLAFALAVPLMVRAESAGVVIDVTLKPAGDFKARTNEIKGEAFANGEGVKAENISVSLANLKSGISLRDRHAREKYLEVDKFPEAVLVKATGQGGKGTGLLKMRGIEKSVSGTYTISGDWLMAEFAIRLSEFGITNIQYMGIGVNDEVTVQVTVPYKKK